MIKYWESSFGTCSRVQDPDNGTARMVIEIRRLNAGGSVVVEIVSDVICQVRPELEGEACAVVGLETAASVRSQLRR